MSDRVLMSFNPSFPVVVACDSSAYGIGGVLSHRLPDGTDRPVAFASRTLSQAERKYAQIEEALALYWGVERFRLYLEGRPFILVTDHKPLRYIMAPEKAVPLTAAARLQRWCLFLGAFAYQIEFRPTKEHASGDGLSRLPLSRTTTETPDEVALLNTSLIESLPVTAKAIRKCTRNDPTLSTVVDYVLEGWPAQDKSEQLQPYRARQYELTVQNGVWVWDM